MNTRWVALFAVSCFLLAVFFGLALYMEFTRDWSKPIYAASEARQEGSPSGSLALAGSGGGNNEPAGPGMKTFQAKGCSACHAIGGKGPSVGPDLAGVGARRDAEWLDSWLADPAAVKPGTTMPKLPLTDEERRILVEFLRELK